jgi:hypothetical protein
MSAVLVWIHRSLHLPQADVAPPYPDSVVFGLDTERLDTVAEEEGDASSDCTAPGEGRLDVDATPAEWYPRERLPNGVPKSADETGWKRR